jgi:hypothetical protein
LADAHYRRGLAGLEPAIIAFARSVDYARLAAMNRGERLDWLTFLFILDAHAAVLRAAGFTHPADLAQAEALALAEYMADDGDEEIGNMVVASAERLSPSVLHIVRGRHSLLLFSGDNR